MNECCEHNPNGCNWAVGHNMPGYMPDNPAEHFEDWEDAFDHFEELCEDFGVSGTDRAVNGRNIELTHKRTGEIFWLVRITV